METGGPAYPFEIRVILAPSGKQYWAAIDPVFDMFTVQAFMIS
jgi:hypothetical protein